MINSKKCHFNGILPDLRVKTDLTPGNNDAVASVEEFRLGTANQSCPRKVLN